MGRSLYQGFVLRAGTSPVQVWLPDKDKVYVPGTFRCMSKQHLNDLSSEDLVKLRNTCDYYAVCSELSSGGMGYYDEGTGKATVQDGARDISTMKIDPNGGYRYNNPGQNYTVRAKAASPANNGLVSYLPETTDGTTVGTRQNQSRGSFKTLTVGTRVVVGFIDGTTRGVILCQLPWEDESSTVQGDVTNQAGIVQNAVSNNSIEQTTTTKTTGYGSRHINQVTRTDAFGGASIRTDQLSKEITRTPAAQFYGSNKFSQTANNEVKSVGGVKNVQCGSSVNIVGSVSGVQGHNARGADEAQANYKALRVAIPDDRHEDSKFNIISELASVPKTITKGLTKSIKPNKTKIEFKPTGNVLTDMANLLVYYEQRFQEISVASIAEKALMTIKSEAERLEKQFENATNIEDEWLYNKIVSLVEGGKPQAALTDPSTEGTEKSSRITKKKVQEEAANAQIASTGIEAQGGN